MLRLTQHERFKHQQSESIRMQLEPIGTVLDNLNHAEKLGLIVSVADWIEARNLRNSLVYEYTERCGTIATKHIASISTCSNARDCSPKTLPRKQKTGMTETAIRITHLSKCHEIYGYGTPTDWLKQTSCPNLKNRS